MARTCRGAHHVHRRRRGSLTGCRRSCGSHRDVAGCEGSCAGRVEHDSGHVRSPDRRVARDGDLEGPCRLGPRRATERVERRHTSVDDARRRCRRHEQPDGVGRRTGAGVGADEVDDQVTALLGEDVDRATGIDRDDCLIGGDSGPARWRVEVRRRRCGTAHRVHLPVARSSGDRREVDRDGVRSGCARDRERSRLAGGERGDAPRVHDPSRRCECLESTGGRRVSGRVVAEQVDDDVAAGAAVDVNHTVSPDGHGHQVGDCSARQRQQFVDVEVGCFRSSAGVRPHGEVAGTERRCHREVEHCCGHRARGRERRGSRDTHRERTPWWQRCGQTSVNQTLRHRHRHVRAGGTGGRRSADGASDRSDHRATDDGSDQGRTGENGSKTHVAMLARTATSTPARLLADAGIAAHAVISRSKVTW